MIRAIFTHLWVKGFGWENTVFVFEDFVSVEDIDVTNGLEVVVFMATDENGTEYLLKGYYE